MAPESIPHLTAVDQSLLIALIDSYDGMFEQIRHGGGTRPSSLPPAKTLIKVRAIFRQAEVQRPFRPSALRLTQFRAVDELISFFLRTASMNPLSSSDNEKNVRVQLEAIAGKVEQLQRRGPPGRVQIIAKEKPLPRGKRPGGKA